MDKRIEGTPLPSAWVVVEMRGRFYPLRHGRFQLNMRARRISFITRALAEAYCLGAQRDLERFDPTPRRGDQ